MSASSPLILPERTTRRRSRPRRRLVGVESLESRRMLVGSIYGFDYLAIQATASTIDVEGLVITDLSTNTPVYVNNFDTGSTAGLDLAYWQDELTQTATSPLNRIEANRLRLECPPGFAVNRARATYATQLPENFEARFTINKVQENGQAYVFLAPSVKAWGWEVANIFENGGLSSVINGWNLAAIQMLGNTFQPSASGPYPQTDVRYRIVKQGASLQVFIQDVLQAQTQAIPVVAPTNILLSATTIAENSNAGTLVGDFSAVDVPGSASPAPTFELVAGPGDTDNASFVITQQRNLRTAVALDFEAGATRSIRVRATDNGGLFTEKTFLISITDVNEAPAAVALANAVTTLTADTSTASRVKVADIVVTDDALGTNLLSLSGADAVSFEIVASALYLKAGTSLDAVARPSLAVTVHVADSTGGPTRSVAHVLTVTPPAIHVPSGQTVTDGTTRTGSYHLVKRGEGTLVLDRSNGHSGGVTVEAGTLVVKHVAALGTGRLTIRQGATVVLDVLAGEVPLAALTFEAGARLDFGFGRVTIASGDFSLADARQVLADGFAGSWMGSAGFFTSVAGSVPGGGLGFLANGDGSLTVAYAAFGDTNLDGFVDVLDAADLASSGKYNSGIAAAWAEGDFNYDGMVDVLDLAAMASGGLYGSGSYLPSAGIRSSSLQAAFAEAAEDPAGTGLVFVGPRRRR